MQMVQNVVLFQGVSATGNVGLWEWNGATAVELAPITGAAPAGTPSAPAGLSLPPI
jgi:hypothetical protein